MTHTEREVGRGGGRKEGGREGEVESMRACKSGRTEEREGGRESKSERARERER